MIATARFCWLATGDESGLPRLRPMGRLPPRPGDDAWTLRFVTDGRAKKAANIRRNGAATLVFQSEAEEAFVALTGGRRSRSARPRSGGSGNPTTSLSSRPRRKGSAVFLTVDAERLDLWIRGVTPEPFGLRTTTLERKGSGDWRLAGEGGGA